MSRHLQTFTAHYVNMWGMMRRTVGLMTSCMKYQETHIGFKEKYNRSEILCSLMLDHVVIDANGLITWEIVGSYVIDGNGLV
jgi:hypothetical protein